MTQQCYMSKAKRKKEKVTYIDDGRSLATDEEVAKRKFEEEHRGYDVYMEDAMRRGEYRYPVKKKETHITDEERESHLIRTLGPITYKDWKMLGLI